MYTVYMYNMHTVSLICENTGSSRCTRYIRSTQSRTHTMPLPIGPAQPRSALHVYRHLLREASYLPPVCRAQIEPRIRYRFRKHRNDLAPGPRVQAARHEFRNLRAANLGSKDRMYHVMLLTFGRSGWRRRALFTELRQVEQPATSDALEQALQHSTSHGDWLEQWDTKKIILFLKSQASHSPRNSPWPKVTSTKLDPASVIPETNIWGKPFHEKVARTKEMAWWKKCAYRTLPPLPRSEWELLKQLALGKAGPEWDVPSRRTPIAPGTTAAKEKSSADAWDWEKYAIMPIRDIERHKSRRLRIYFETTSEHADSSLGGPAIGVHKYTPRFWRRLYALVWQMTPMMEKTLDGSKGGWNITWGGAPLELAPTTSAHSELFEGVDASTGFLLEGSNRKPQKKGRGNNSDGEQKKAQGRAPRPGTTANIE